MISPLHLDNSAPGYTQAQMETLLAISERIYAHPAAQGLAPTLRAVTGCLIMECYRAAYEHLCDLELELHDARRAGLLPAQACEEIACEIIALRALLCPPARFAAVAA